MTKNITLQADLLAQEMDGDKKHHLARNKMTTIPRTTVSTEAPLPRAALTNTLMDTGDFGKLAGWQYPAAQVVETRTPATSQGL